MTKSSPIPSLLAPKEQEALLQAVFQAVPVGVAVLSADRIFLMCNDRTGELFGYGTDELLGQSSRIVYEDEETYSGLGHALYDHLWERGSTAQEVKMRRRDGSAFFASLMTAPLDPQNPKAGVVTTVLDISERKNVERQRQESEELFRALFDAAPYSCSVHDENGRYTHVNEAAVREAQVPAEQILGRTLLELGLVDEATFKLLQDMSRQHERLDGLEFTVTPAINKEPLHCLLSSRRFQLHGKTHRVSAIVNITDRKRAEEALEKRLVALTRPMEDTDIRFEDLFNIDDIQRLQDQFSEATGVASLITRCDGSAITRPSRFCRLCNDIIRKTEKGRHNCGLSDIAIGKMLPEGPTVQPCLSGGLWDAGAAITVGGQHIANWLIGQVRNEAQSEDRIAAYAREIGADERESVLAFRDVPAMSTEQFDRIAQMLFTLAGQLSKIAYQNIQQARFITDRKHALAVLSESEEKFRRLIDGTQTGFVIIGDTEGLVLDANSHYLKLTGRSSMNDIIGHHVSEWTKSHDREHSKAVIEACFSDTLLHTDILEHEAEDGTLIITEVTASSMTLQNRKVILALCRNITDKRQETARLQHQQKLEAIGTLAGGVAHEINNPINIIMNYAQLINGDAESDSQAAQDSAAIIRESQRIAGIVKNLLAFSRQENERHSPASISEIVNATLSLTHKLLSKDQITLVTDFTEDVPRLKCRSQQIMQVIMNLITNARDALNERYPAFDADKIIRLAVGRFDEDGHPWIRVAVTDHGAGIPEGIQARIFDPFFTSKTKDKGTGLGLAISHGIVEEHNGRLWFETQPGTGTTFYLDLPVDNGWKPTSTGLIVEDDESSADPGSLVQV